MKNRLFVISFFIICIFTLFNIRLFASVSQSNELRKMVLMHGLIPVPATWKEVKKIVANPQNPLSIKKISLGRSLFFDPILSRDETLTCASCHIIQDGGDDNRPTAIGYHNQKNPKHLNSPTVLNAALAKSEFWDGRSPNVEDQAKGPIQTSFEMDMTSKEVIERVKKEQSYVQVFKEVFPKEGITFNNITKAIGAYERTLLTRGTFDDFLDGSNSAISSKAKKGLSLFINLGCVKCHTGMDIGGQSMQKFPKFRFQSSHFKSSPFPFVDIGKFHGKNGKFLFKVPTLRNITRTAPYFHNGTVKNIKEAVRIAAKYQLGITISKKQIDQIVAFLKTLVGGPVNYNIFSQYK